MCELYLYDIYLLQNIWSDCDDEMLAIPMPATDGTVEETTSLTSASKEATASLTSFCTTSVSGDCNDTTDASVHDNTVTGVSAVGEIVPSPVLPNSSFGVPGKEMVMPISGPVSSSTPTRSARYVFSQWRNWGSRVGGERGGCTGISGGAPKSLPVVLPLQSI